MISRAWEVTWARLRSWHFISPPTESAKAVGWNVTGFPIEEEEAGFSGGQMAMAESRGGKTREEVVAIPRLCYVGELARTSQAGWWRGLSLHPLQPSVSSHRDCASSHS